MFDPHEKMERALVRLYQKRGPGPMLEDAHAMVRRGYAVVTVPALGAVKLTPEGEARALEILATNQKETT